MFPHPKVPNRYCNINTIQYLSQGNTYLLYHIMYFLLKTILILFCCQTRYGQNNRFIDYSFIINNRLLKVNTNIIALNYYQFYVQANSGITWTESKKGFSVAKVDISVKMARNITMYHNSLLVLTSLYVLIMKYENVK